MPASSRPAARGRTIVATCSLAAVLGLAACGSSVDTDSVVKDAKEGLAALGVEVADVSCPDDISGDAGTKFECTVKTADGTEAKIPYVVGEENVTLDQEAAAAPLATLTGGGEAAAGADEAAIEQIINAISADPAALCGLATEEYLEQFGGAEGCVEAAAEQEPSPDDEILEINVDGDTATATVRDADGDDPVEFERQEDGSFLISGPIS